MGGVLSVGVRAHGNRQGVLEVLGPGPPQIELDPLEAVLVGMGTEAGPEAADLAVDGGPVPPAGLEAPESAGLVPGHPEADELGVLDGRGGHLIPDEGRVVLDGADRDVGPLIGTGPHALGQRLPEGGLAAVGDPPPFGALAGVGSVVGGLGHRGSQVCDCSGALSSPFFKKLLRVPTLVPERRLYRLFGRQEALVPMGITAGEARKNLLTLIEQVNDDRRPVEITSRRGDAVLMSRADYRALEETAYLLRPSANARYLLESLEQAQRR